MSENLGTLRYILEEDDQTACMCCLHNDKTGLLMKKLHVILAVVFISFVMRKPVCRVSPTRFDTNLRSHCAADLHLCFRICKIRFCHDTALMVYSRSSKFVVITLK